MSILSIMSLWLLAACNGGNSDDTGTNPDTEDCDDIDGGECDTGTDPAATGSFTAPKVALPDGTLEDCVSNLDEAFSVPSGTTETGIPVGEYEMTFGSLDLATEYSDWLGVHTSSDGSQWIAASEVASIAKDTTLAPEAPVVSRYIGGQTWTCNWVDGDEDTSQTVIVSYIDGDSLQINLGIGIFGIPQRQPARPDDGLLLRQQRVPVLGGRLRKSPRHLVVNELQNYARPHRPGERRGLVVLVREVVFCQPRETHRRGNLTLGHSHPPHAL
jgi:hypothetical protein